MARVTKKFKHEKKKNCCIACYRRRYAISVGLIRSYLRWVLQWKKRTKNIYLLSEMEANCHVNAPHRQNFLFGSCKFKSQNHFFFHASSNRWRGSMQGELFISNRVCNFNDEMSIIITFTRTPVESSVQVCHVRAFCDVCFFFHSRCCCWVIFVVYSWYNIFPLAFSASSDARLGWPDVMWEKPSGTCAQ